MSVAKEIGDQLAAVLHLTVGVDVCEGLLPETPDTCIAVYERPGRPPVRASAKTVVCERPGVQLLVRSADYEAGYALIKQARGVLQGFVGTLGSTRYLDVNANGSIHSLGTDESRRFLLSLNFAIMKEAS